MNDPDRGERVVRRNLLELFDLSGPGPFHASIVAWLLDPAGSHGLGARPLDALGAFLVGRGAPWVAATDAGRPTSVMQRTRSGRCEVVVTSGDQQLTLICSLDGLHPLGPDAFTGVATATVAGLGLTGHSFTADALAAHPVWTYEALLTTAEPLAPTDAHTHFLVEVLEHVRGRIDAGTRAPAPSTPSSSPARTPTPSRQPRPDSGAGTRPTGRAPRRPSAAALGSLVDDYVQAQQLEQFAMDAPVDMSLGEEMLLSEDMSRAYVIEQEPLGVGGQGTVYRVKITGDQEFPGFARPVETAVLKHAHETAKKAVRREREIYADSDRSVVKLLDAGTAQDRPYLILERLYPHPYQRFREGGAPSRVDLATSIDTFVTLLESVARIHTRPTRPLVVCDIKPDNIMVRMSIKDGEIGDDEYLRRIASGAYEPVLMDLGCALDLADLSRDGNRIKALIGTPLYLPPESIPFAEESGEMIGGFYSPKTDVYALTMSFYEYLTGRRPYDHRGLHQLKGRDFLFELLEFKRDAVFPVEMAPLAQLYGAETAEVLQQILRRGLAANPQERASARELLVHCQKQFGTSQRIKAEMSEYQFDLVKGLRSWQTRFPRIEPEANVYVTRRA